MESYICIINFIFSKPLPQLTLKSISLIYVLIKTEMYIVKPITYEKIFTIAKIQNLLLIRLVVYSTAILYKILKLTHIYIAHITNINLDEKLQRMYKSIIQVSM